MLRSLLQNATKFLLGLLQRAPFEEQLPQEGPSPGVAGMRREAIATDMDRLIQQPLPAVDLGELGKDKWVRILFTSSGVLPDVPGRIGLPPALHLITSMRTEHLKTD